MSGDVGGGWRGDAARVLQAWNGLAAASQCVRKSEHDGRPALETENCFTVESGARKGEQKICNDNKRNGKSDGRRRVDLK